MPKLTLEQCKARLAARPKHPVKLSKAELVTIVEELQDFMFREDEGWDPDKDINGGDLVERIVEIFKHNGLVPKDKPKG